MCKHSSLTPEASGGTWLLSGALVPVLASPAPRRVVSTLPLLQPLPGILSFNQMAERLAAGRANPRSDLRNRVSPNKSATSQEERFCSLESPPAHFWLTKISWSIKSRWPAPKWFCVHNVLSQAPSLLNRPDLTSNIYRRKQSYCRLPAQCQHSPLMFSLQSRTAVVLFTNVRQKQK